MTLRTDSDTVKYKETAKSLCGNPEPEIDTDEDGAVGSCLEPQFEYDPNIGICPSLLEPVDLDEDGETDQCVVPTTTTTTTTTDQPATTTTPTPPPPQTTGATTPTTTTSDN